MPIWYLSDVERRRRREREIFYYLIIFVPFDITSY
jgi:hypothetical protein